MTAISGTYNRHYCYSIVFADGCTYYGVRTCRCSVAADSYTGSPKTYAAKWQTSMPRVKRIVSVHATRRLANIAEARLITDFWRHSKELSLNAFVHSVGYHTLGRVHTAETRAKLVRSASGRLISPETRAKISEAGRLRKQSSETRAKISKSNKGKTVTAETRAKLSKPKTAKHKAKLSEARKGMPSPRKGCELSTETRIKLSKLRSTANVGRKWYTNGLTNKFLLPYSPVPEGFCLGRAKNLARQDHQCNSKQVSE